VRSQEDPKFKNLKSETLRKTEKLKKVDEEKKVLKEVLFSVRKELAQVGASITTQEPARKAEVVEVGVQASSDMVDASTEPWEEALVEARERKKGEKRTEERKRTEKGKERAKDSGLEKQEDEVMLDAGRYSPYED